MRTTIMTGLVVTALALTGCSGSDDQTAAGDSTAEETDDDGSAATTTAAATTTTTSTTTTDPATTTSTTADPTWNRDAELAVRNCLDEARLATDWIEFMIEFDDPEPVREIQDACDAASAQLELEDGKAAADVALTIAKMNFDLALAVAAWTGLGEYDTGYDYFTATRDAEQLIP